MGEVGRRAARLFLLQNPGARVLGLTRTEASAELNRKRGLSCETIAGLDAFDGDFQNMILAYPPSGFDRTLLDSYKKKLAPNAKVVAISSLRASRNPKLLEIEDASKQVLTARILRFAGLYSLKRGPHAVYLRTPERDDDPEGIINLIHDFDAARACLAMLAVEKDPGVVSLSDGHAISRKKIVDLCFSSPALMKHFPAAVRCHFSGRFEHDGEAWDPQAEWAKLNSGLLIESFDLFTRSVDFFGL